MLKLLIKRQDTKRFQDIFKFLVENKCEMALFSDGLKYRSDNINGIIYKDAFVEYPITKTKPLGKINGNNKTLKEFFGKWKDLDGLITEIPLMS